MSSEVKIEDFEGVSDEDFVTEEEVESYYSVDEEFYESQEGIAEEFRKQDNPKPEDYESEEGSEDVFDAPVEVSYDREGFTGEVTQSVFVTKKFPHIQIEDISAITNIKLKLLQRMLKGFQAIGNTYPVYAELNGTLVELGNLQDYQMQAFINTVGEEGLVGRLSENKELRGHMLYAMSSM